MNSCVQSSEYYNMSDPQTVLCSCYYNNQPLSADITGAPHSNDTHLSNLSTNWYQSFQTSHSPTVTSQVNNSEEMSFSQKQIISNEILSSYTTHYEQASEEHWSKTWKRQYPLITHNQLPISNLSTSYLSSSNVYLNTLQATQNTNYTVQNTIQAATQNTDQLAQQTNYAVQNTAHAAPQNIAQQVFTESPILIKKELQNLNVTKKESGEINQKQRSLQLRKTDKFNRNILRRKRNSFLRIKILSPKNALNLLKEVYPQLKIKVTKELCETQELFTSKVNIDGYEFKATDLTKKKTNERACEEALKTILFTKGLDSTSESTDGSVEADDFNATTESAVEKIKEENCCWSLLTSYAIFKLFSEWEKQGFHAQKLTQVAFVPDIIPRKHPVQLLHEIKPNWKFIEEKEGSSPNFRFKASIVNEGQIFTGTGRSKKLARKDCAENVLKEFGVQYLWG